MFLICGKYKNNLRDAKSVFYTLTIVLRSKFGFLFFKFIKKEGAKSCKPLILKPIHSKQKIIFLEPKTLNLSVYY